MHRHGVERLAKKNIIRPNPNAKRVSLSYRMRGLLTLSLLLYILIPVSAQKYVLIEKAGNPRTERIALYEDIKFQLKDDAAGWYTRTILDMDVDGQMILLGDSWTPVSEISRMRLKRERLWAHIIGGALQVGGLTMFFGDLWNTVNNKEEFSEGGMEFGALNFAVGTAIRTFVAPITIDFGKRKRLRVVDLTF